MTDLGVAQNRSWGNMQTQRSLRKRVEYCLESTVSRVQLQEFCFDEIAEFRSRFGEFREKRSDFVWDTDINKLKGTH